MLLWVEVQSVGFRLYSNCLLLRANVPDLVVSIVRLVTKSACGIAWRCEVKLSAFGNFHVLLALAREQVELDLVVDLRLHLVKVA